MVKQLFIFLIICLATLGSANAEDSSSIIMEDVHANLQDMSMVELLDVEVIVPCKRKKRKPNHLCRQHCFYKRRLKRANL